MDVPFDTSLLFDDILSDTQAVEIGFYRKNGELPRYHLCEPDQSARVVKLNGTETLAAVCDGEALRREFIKLRSKAEAGIQRFSVGAQ